MSFIKKYFLSFFLLLLGLLAARTQIVVGDGCIGMVEFLLFILLGVIYTIVLFVSLFISISKYFQKKGGFNFIPLVVTLVIGLLVFAVWYAEKFESPTLLNAKSKKRNILVLKQNENFKIKMQEIEWVCYFKGEYKIKNDTLELLRDDIDNITDGKFTNMYFISYDKNYLYPLDIEMKQDTMLWLEITDMNN